MTDLVRLTADNDIAIVTIDNPPVNALSSEVSDGLRSAIKTAGADPQVRAIVVICAGRTFIAGADIKELEAVAQGQGPAGGPDAHDLNSTTTGRTRLGESH